MTVKVSIIGGAGYGAAEILRQLLPRDDVEVLRLSSKDHIGEPISSVHRSFYGYDQVLEDITPTECAEGADVVFLCMPHITTAKVAIELFDLPVRIIDLSGDFRLRDVADYHADYAPEHPCPEELSTFVYGMPELFADEIASADRVASPGCFATGIALGLIPLAEAGLLDNRAVHTTAITGSSGSGVRPQAGTHHATRDGNVRAYKMLHHQHRSEILQTLRTAGANKPTLDFVPVSGPYARGILAISLLEVPPGTTEADMANLFMSRYADNPLVVVHPAGVSAEVGAVAGTVRTEIGLAVSERDGRTTLAVTSAIDNLIKGGAGQAIQSFNLMNGHPAHHGLTTLGPWP